MENAAIGLHPSCRWMRWYNQIPLTMKLTMLLMTAALLQVHASTSAQTATMSGRKVELTTVFAAIKKQTGYVAFYGRGVLSNAPVVSYSVKDMPLEEFL